MGFLSVLGQFVVKSHSLCTDIDLGTGGNSFTFWSKDCRIRVYQGQGERFTERTVQRGTRRNKTG